VLADKPTLSRRPPRVKAGDGARVEQVGGSPAARVA